jgi:hypothetical protein
MIGVCKILIPIIRNSWKKFRSKEHLKYIFSFPVRKAIFKIINILAILAFVFGAFYNLYLIKEGKEYSLQQKAVYENMQKSANALIELTHAINLNKEIDFDSTRLKEIYNNERKMLYPAIQNYIRPIAVFETERDTVRVDQIDIDTFRYAVWAIGKKQSSKPDLILNTNKVNFENGIKTFVFRNGTNDYYDYVVSLSENIEKDTLKVYYKRILLDSYNVLNVLFKGY